MLRLSLGTLFLCSLLFPFIAEHILAGRKRQFPVEPYYGRYSQPPETSLLDFSTHHAMTIAVIYPGLAVLMTMAAYYFLRAMEPKARHDNPVFMRSALALSAVWVCGFYPFLSSALGGVLFCASAAACIAAWLIIRRHADALRPLERVAVFWAFFFFSVIAALLVTGNGQQMGGFFSRILTALQSGAESATPLVLLALHSAAVLAVARLMGWRLNTQASPQTILGLKILGIAGGLLLLDLMVMDIRYGGKPEWITLPLLALPSLAYYGIFRLVMRMAPPLRGRVTLVLFAALAAFIALLACLQAGVPAATIFMGGAGIGIAAAAAFGIALLWKSDADVNLKVTIMAGFGFFLLVLAMISK
jgi:hypothetical protein